MKPYAVRLSVQIHRLSFAKRQLAWWSTRAGFAVADQATFSGANFLVNLLLARWLTPADYGAFAIAFTVFLFVSGFHNSLIQEPVVVLGASVDGPALPGYLGHVFWLHLGLTSLIGSTIAASSMLAGTAALRDSLWAIGLASPVILLEWLLRRVCYLRGDAAGAFLSSCVYAIILLTMVGLLYYSANLSPATAIAAMAAASIGGVVQRWRRLGIKVQLPWEPSVIQGIRSVFASDWRIGRWIALQAILLLGGTYVQTLATGWLLGLEGAGILRAVSLVTLPIGQAMNALGSVLGLPVLARKHSRGDHLGFRKDLKLMLVFLGGIAITYELALILLRDPIATFLLKDKAASMAWLIPLVGFGPIISAMSAYGLALRAAQRTAYYPISGLASSVAGLATSLVFVEVWGIPGALASTLVSSAAVSLVSWYLYRRWLSGASVELGRQAVEQAEARY